VISKKDKTFNYLINLSLNKEIKIKNEDLDKIHVKKLDL
jgi:hypothetical protein